MVDRHCVADVACVPSVQKRRGTRRSHRHREDDLLARLAPWCATVVRAHRTEAGGKEVKLFKIYEAGSVRRYHAKHTLVDQSVADHTWGVMLVLYWLYHPEPPPASMLRSALFHDVAEIVT